MCASTLRYNAIRIRKATMQICDKLIHIDNHERYMIPIYVILAQIHQLQCRITTLQMPIIFQMPKHIV